MSTHEKPEKDPEHRLEAPASPAAMSPAANHEDPLSPSKALRETVGATGSQRVGSDLHISGPLTSWPNSEDLAEKERGGD